ncbi:hypothetical protein [Marinomonas shanghaiensis]|uniref:hypothetical protein n=1 Tax=Marinomonas shanghaiensis TaxID=2202418 RepID=UPI000DBA63B8|nr:hypothetical protein [Marinomonas shanghaiensis]
MKITANQIEAWGDTRDAQAELPRLIRKLISSTNQLTALAMPAGDSIYRPGWDGKVTSSSASVWVPEGDSVWEIGCNSGITSKANDDFNKRVEQLPKLERENTHYVFVSPRRWHKKEIWQQEKTSLGEWQTVSVIDADDIETWLENTPSVAIEFAEILGLTGFGITSLSKFWVSWSKASSPPISRQAITSERQPAIEKLKELIEHQKPLIVVEADSREEAIAFCCSVLSDHPIQSNAACVTEDEGWRFVDRNPNIKLCISDTYGSKYAPSSREGMTVIQPVCHGDPHTPFENAANRIVVTRLKPDDFKKALIELGEEESDARRLTSSTGRSWSVYRRIKANNPAIKTPGWIEKNDSDCLAILMLIGAWSSDKKGDVAFIEALTNKPYCIIENALAKLVNIDDSPVLNISNIWKAKSPIELLYLITPTIPSSLFCQFFILCKSILELDDPQLELPEEQRFMAAIYKKVRNESGVIIESILDSLSRLKVFGENSGSSNSREISRGIDDLVRELLFDVDESRWMSLSSYLPRLAEASPDVYLDCLEKSLRRPDKSVTALITNTTSSGAMGQCWYSGLLWSLEVIAWNASKLPRVTYILIELNKIPKQSNWSNSPFSTLQSFYRAVSAATLAIPEQKIEILEQVIRKYPDFSWTFLLSLVPSPLGGFWMQNAKPKWREDDAGSDSEKGTYYPHYLSWIGETILKLAVGKPKRIAKLLKNYFAFEGEFKQRLISLVRSVADFDDLDKEITLMELRSLLNLQQRKKVNDEIDEGFQELEKIYFSNQPEDLFIRYRWLFGLGGHLPEGDRRDFRAMEELLSQRRIEAIKHIVFERGVSGIKEFRTLVNEQHLLGFHLVKCDLGLTEEALVQLLIEQFLEEGAKYKDAFVSGIINAVENENLVRLLAILEEKIADFGLNIDQQVSLFTCLRPIKQTFELVDRQNREVQDSYWRKVQFKFGISDDVFELILLKYIENHRYISAFSMLPHDFIKTEPKLVYNILKSMMTVVEEGVDFPDSYSVRKAIESVSESTFFSQSELAYLEFIYFSIYDTEQLTPPNLKKELLINPKMFFELIRHSHPIKGELLNADDGFISNENLAEFSWRILHHIKGVPGQLENNTIDESQFNSWVAETRKLGRDHDRETVTDTIIGEWISQCPHEQEDIWPCFSVCELLEDQDSDIIRRGFSTGVYNNRGVTSRAFSEGGRQERVLVDRYKGYADKVRSKYPTTARLLDELAKGYEYEANRQDDEVSIRYEIE